MSAFEIAHELFMMCAWVHKDGRPYKDDALDTWAYIFADAFPDVSWDAVQAQLSIHMVEEFTPTGVRRWWTDTTMDSAGNLAIAVEVKRGRG